MRLLLRICDAVSDANFVCGILLNLLLFHLIRRFSTKEIGTYKYLLQIFAAYDAYLVFMHQLINPIVIPSRTGFAVCSDTKFDSRMLLSFCSSGYAVPFVLLNVHFLYRYWLIRHPYLIALFSNTKFKLFMVSLTAMMQTSWCLSCYYLGEPEDLAEIREYQAFFREEYDHDIHEGCIIMNYWRDDKFMIRPFLLLVVADSIEIFSFTLAAILAISTYRLIRQEQNMSKTVRDFHLRILIAASAQTLTPAIFVYTPYFLNVSISFFHIYWPTFSAISMVLLSFFPEIDAIVIIVLMKPYREGLLSIFGMGKSARVVQVSTTSGSGSSTH